MTWTPITLTVINSTQWTPINCCTPNTTVMDNVIYRSTCLFLSEDHKMFLGISYTTMQFGRLQKWQQASYFKQWLFTSVKPGLYSTIHILFARFENTHHSGLSWYFPIVSIHCWICSDWTMCIDNVNVVIFPWTQKANTAIWELIINEECNKCINKHHAYD